MKFPNEFQKIFIRANLGRRSILFPEEGLIRIRLKPGYYKYLFLGESLRAYGKSGDAFEKLPAARFYWLATNDHHLGQDPIYQMECKEAYKPRTLIEFLDNYQDWIPEKVLMVFIFNLEKLT